MTAIAAGRNPSRISFLGERGLSLNHRTAHRQTRTTRNAKTHNLFHTAQHCPGSSPTLVVFETQKSIFIFCKGTSEQHASTYQHESAYLRLQNALSFLLRFFSLFQAQHGCTFFLSPSKDQFHRQKNNLYLYGEITQNEFIPQKLFCTQPYHRKQQPPN